MNRRIPAIARQLQGVVSLLIVPIGTAWADTSQIIPEPGVLELSTLGGVIAIAVAWIRRGK